MMNKEHAMNTMFENNPYDNEQQSEGDCEEEEAYKYTDGRQDQSE
ncbi:hypothetical protein N9L68_06370 [bacterium]|nr:hypothetical protein [bacterium]